MKRILIMSVLPVLFAAGVSAKVTTPSIIGDNMVLQRNTEVSLWGWASPGKAVTVTTSWNGNEYTAKAGRDGRWAVEVSTGDAGGPYSISVSDGEESTIGNVMLGEVWICSGQSNMSMPVCGYMNQPVEGSVEAITGAVNHPGIRMFDVPTVSSQTPVEDISAGWKTSSPASVSSFSAVAYFFGKMLSEQLGVPVGLIDSSWGGSAIEAWMTVDAIDATEGINHETAKSGKADNAIPQRLYNGMIAPICNFTAKGFIWYQGESNRHNGFDYCALQVALAELWRESWGEERMPFYFTQLAPFRYEGDELRSLPVVIEAQYRAMERIPYSGIAATTDLGNGMCIHPSRKREVGERLAYLALAADYGVAGFPAPAPTYSSMERNGDRITVSFNNLSPKEGWELPDSFAIYSADGAVRPAGFEIAGADRVFYRAKAAFTRGLNTIEVWADEVPEPVAVRYAFRNHVPEANVKTTMGQPLAPFRTDDWPIDDAWKN